MLKWSGEIYLGEGIEDRCGKIIRMLNSGKIPPNVFIITMSENSNDQLEIMDSIYLRQPILRRMLPEIIGLALNKSEAIKMVHLITKTCVESTGDALIRNFLNQSPAIKELKKIRTADYI